MRECSPKNTKKKQTKTKTYKYSNTSWRINVKYNYISVKSLNHIKIILSKASPKYLNLNEIHNPLVNHC